MRNVRKLWIKNTCEKTRVFFIIISACFSDGVYYLVPQSFMEQRRKLFGSFLRHPGFWTTACLTLLATLAAQLGVFAAAPNNIVSYQGRLLDVNGVPVTSASATMIFRLYDDVAAGSCLWSNSSTTCASATGRTVTLTDGLFSENLGDTNAGTPYSAIADTTFADNAAVYLSISVNGELLTPRKLLTAAPYALNAQALDGLSSSGFLQTTLPASSSVGFGASNYNLTFTNNGSGNEVHNLTSTGDFIVQNDSVTFFTLNNSKSLIYDVKNTGTATFQSTTMVADRTTGLLSVAQWNEPVLFTGLTTDSLFTVLQYDTDSTGTAAYILQRGDGIAFQVDDVLSDTTPFYINSLGNVFVGGTTDGNDALTIEGGDILVSDGNLDLSGGDFNVGLDDGDAVNIDGDGTPTEDLLLLGSGDTSSTDGYDPLAIVSYLLNAGGTAINIQPNFTTNLAKDYSTIKINGFNATTTANVASVVRGVDIEALTQTEDTVGNITSTALNIGSGWDTGISVAGGNNTFTLGAAQQVLIDASTTNHTSNSPLTVNFDYVGVGGIGSGIEVNATSPTGMAALDYISAFTATTVAHASDNGSSNLSNFLALYDSTAATAGSVDLFAAIAADDAGTFSEQFTGPGTMRGINIDIESAPATTDTGFLYGAYIKVGDAGATNYSDGVTGSEIIIADLVSTSSIVHGSVIDNQSGIAGDYGAWIAGAWDLGLVVGDGSELITTGLYVQHATTGLYTSDVTTDITTTLNEDLTILGAGSGDVILNLPGTGDFVVQDNGDVFATFLANGGFLYTLDNVDSPSYSIVNQGSGDIINNLASTGDFVIHDTGIPFFTFNDTKEVTYAPLNGPGLSITPTLVDGNRTTSAFTLIQNNDGTYGSTGTAANSLFTILQNDTDSSGTAAYFLQQGSGIAFQVDDVSGDTSPFLIEADGDVFLGATAETNSNSGFTMDGNDMFIAGSLGVESSVYTDGSFVAGASTTISNGSISQSSGEALAVGTTSADLTLQTTTSGDIVLSPAGTSGVGIGTAAPIAPLHVAGRIPSAQTDSVGSLNDPRGMYVQGRYAYVVNRFGDTLQIYDVTDPADISAVIGSVATGSQPWNVSVQGKYAYVVSAGSDTLQVYDVSNPASPTQTGSVAIDPASHQDVYVRGRYAYVVGAEGGASNLLQIFDVSNPAVPVAMDTQATSGTDPYGVFVQGKYAYVVTYGSDLLEIYDISNPALISALVGSVATGDGPASLYVQGQNAYVGTLNCCSATLQVFDVSTPSAPAAGDSTLTTSYGNRDVYVQGRYAYVAGEAGSVIDVFDVSSSASLTLVGSISTGTNPNTVFVQGRYLYSTNISSNTLQSFDVGGAYIQQLETGGIETGTLSIQNAITAIDGAFSGGLSVSQSLEVFGNLSVSSTIADSTQGWGLGLTSSAAFTGSAIDFDNTADSAWTGNVVDIDTGTGNATGNLIDLNIEDSTNDDVQGIVLNAAGALDQAGWGMEVLATGAFTGSVWDFDNTGNTAFTGSIIDIDTGTGAGATNLFDINIEDTTADDVQAFVLNQAGTSDQEGWAFEINATGAYTANVFDFDSSSTGSGNVIDITFATAAATGNAIDLNMGTNLAGKAIDAVSGALATSDLMALTLTSTADSAGIDALSITGTASNQTNQTVNLINASLTSSGTAGGDIANGMTINLASSAGATTTGIVLTGSWLTGINIGGASTGLNFSSTSITTDISMQNGETIANNVDGEVDISAELIINLDGGATTGEALCGNQADGDAADTNDVRISDCSAAPSADYMEMYPTAADVGIGDILVPGTETVTAQNGTTFRQLVKSSGAYQPNVLGIASNPADAGDFNSIGYNIDEADRPWPVALNGRVPVKVNSENGSIVPGDMITTSSVSGVGMKATEPGMVVGMAIDSWTGPGTGTVMVFVQTGWHAGSAISTDGSMPLFTDSFAFASLGTATAVETGTGSETLSFRGSGWNGTSAEQVGMGIKLAATDATAYRLSFTNKTDTEVAYVTGTGDLVLSGKLYPSDRGTAQTDKYIYYDGSAGPGGDFMRTNASGWSTGSYDFAEMFPSTQGLAPGELVVASPNGGTAHVERSSLSYQKTLLGIVSTKPGFLAGDNKEGHFPIALKGRVPTLVNNENGPIAVGDPLTSSSTQGYAMKAVKAGPVVGYALEPFTGSQGAVIAFVSLGWWEPDAVVAPVTTTTSGIANTASQTPVGSSLSSLNIDGGLFMAGNDILSVGRIAGIADRWSIEEDGTVQTEGTYKAVITSLQNEKIDTYATLNREQKVTLSGTGRLTSGMATIQFEAIDPKFNDITSTTAPVRVLVTLRGPANGVYVATADHNGFDVRELANGASTVDFDWYAEAYRLGQEPQTMTGTPVEPPPVEPVVTEPVPTEPVVVEPVVTDSSPESSSSPLSPSLNQGGGDTPAEPIVVEPVIVEPVVTEPTPVPTEPVVAEPVVWEPAPVEPVVTP